MAERPLPPPAPQPWAPPPSPLAALGDAQVLALKVVGAVLLVVVVSVGLLLYDSQRDAADIAELRRLAAGGGVAATPDDTPASLWVNAEPIGATVLVDGDSVGTTPLWLESVPAGAHRVQIIGPDGTRIDTTLTLAAGAMTELDPQARLEADADVEGPATEAVEFAEAPAAEPTPLPSATGGATMGSLRVTSAPDGAAVLLDGRRVGTTPVDLYDVRPGRRAVSVAHAGYETAVQQIDVRPGVQFEVVVDLRPVPQAPPPTPRRAEPRPEPPVRAPTAATGTVEILVRPWGRIVIDGETRQRESDTVYRTTLSVGTHRITVSHPQLGTDERTVTVQPGGVSRIEFDLTRGADGT